MTPIETPIELSSTSPSGKAFNAALQAVRERCGDEVAEVILSRLWAFKGMVWRERTHRKEVVAKLKAEVVRLKKELQAERRFVSRAIADAAKHRGTL